MPNQSNRIYSTDDLALLSRVLEEARDAAINGGGLTDVDIQDLTSQLGKVIMDRFVAGETDPERLKKIAVESVQRS